MRHTLTASVLIWTLLLFSPAMAAPINITVSVAPLKYFTEQIGGDRVEVEVMVPAGASPATYEPKPRQMVSLSRSSLYLAIGVPFEHAWLPRISSANPDMAILRVFAGIERMPMAAHHHDEEESHGEEEHRDHDADHGHDNDSGLDPHVWTSPKCAAKIAGNILSALLQADPAGSIGYKTRYNALMNRIQEVDAAIAELMHGKEGKSFMVYHPSWGYFARQYGLKQVPVELEGKEPGPRELAEVIRTARRLGITAVFVQPQFSKKSARTIADGIDGTLVVADPLAENWDENLLDVARRLAAAAR